MGYNAVTSTMGEGSFPRLFLNLFKGKKVIICYDCDEAGRKSSKTVAFLLKEAGANVLLMDLGLRRNQRG
jgi:DNA primase